MSKYLIFCIIFMCSSCEGLFPPFDYKLKIVNNSNVAINYVIGLDYPDTLLLNYANQKIGYKETGFYLEKEEAILPHSSKQIGVNGSWENRFTRNPQGIVMFYLIDANIANRYGYGGIEIIIKDYLFLRRYDLKVEDLQRMNWTITYP